MVSTDRRRTWEGRVSCLCTLMRQTSSSDDSRMFSGFRSRWMIPFRWRYYTTKYTETGAGPLCSTLSTDQYDSIHRLANIKCLTFNKKALSYHETRFSAVLYVTDTLYGKARQAAKSQTTMEQCCYLTIFRSDFLFYLPKVTTSNLATSPEAIRVFSGILENNVNACIVSATVGSYNQKQRRD